jgi:nucleoside-diphosphate-sugar epimerase
MQTILGANGTIASELSKYLPQYTDKIRQASRNPKKVNASDELFSADLLNYQQVEKAVAGSEVTYLLAGLKYDIKVWRDQWPKVMKHTIDACKKHNSKLVFFDNVYSYGLVKGTMTEETPFNPTSKKGEVRAKIATQLLEEIKAGNLQGMIVRAADFYGPNVLLSLTHSMVTEKLKAKKSAQWIGDPKKIHSFTYTPDAGKAVAVLGNTPSAFNQTWHALTSQEKITGEQYVRMACELAGQPYKIQQLPKWGVRALGLFIPVLREFVEMMYQYENDYFFDSSKFEKEFGMSATSYKIGIAETLR